jgi:hypothetical protein
MPSWPSDDHLWIYRAASVNLRLDTVGHVITDDIRATIQTLDLAASGRLFDTPKVIPVTQTLDDDGLATHVGDGLAIVGVLAVILIFVSIGV